MSATATQPEHKIRYLANFRSLCQGCARSLGLATLMLVPLAIQGAEIEPGDSVVVSNDGTKFMAGKEVRALLDKGTEVRIVSARGTWLGGHVMVGDEEVAGWVRRDEVWPKIEVTIPSTTTFALKEIGPLRTRAIKTWFRPPMRDIERGWYKSDFDPKRIVDVFDSLRLKKGFVLRAYRCEDAGDSWGYVWAMPADADFVEPHESLIVDAPSIFRKPRARKPPAALGDVMEAIEGDGSPLSYLAASLLKRELEEYGAAWHGLGWLNHSIIDQDPWQSADAAESPFKPAKRKEWRMLEPAPKQWRPRVHMQKDQVTVTFFTFTWYHRQAICQHTDTYKRDDYRFKTASREVATGPAGIIY